MDFGWVLPVVEKVLGYGIVCGVGILVLALLTIEFFMVFGLLIGVRNDGGDDGENAADNGRRVARDKNKNKESYR